MEQQIMYKFSKMELEQFAIFEDNYNSDVKDVQFQTEAQFSFDRSSSVLCSKIAVTMTAEEKILLKAELKSYFFIHPDSIASLQHDSKTSFAPPLLVQFASLCYGSLRGVLFTKTMNTPLSNYVLPPIYFGNLIDKGFEC